MHGAILELFDTLEGERREMFAADLEGYTREELVAELRTAAELLEGFCIAAQGVGLVPMLATDDCRERVRRAQEIAEQARV